MYTVFIPLPECDDRAPAWVKSEFPAGTDVGAACAERGWLREVPATAKVYAQDGTLLQEGAKPEPVVEDSPEPEPVSEAAPEPAKAPTLAALDGDGGLPQVVKPKKGG